MMSKHALNFTARGLLKRIGNQKTSRAYRNRETIFRQGDAADAMFYIQDGNVKLSVMSKHGKRAVVSILRQGDFFGERCLVRRCLRMSTATAIHQSSIARAEESDRGADPARACVCEAGYCTSPFTYRSHRGRLRGPTP